MKTCRTLNSVGTMSLGVLSPISISRPTNVMMDMKMEKSLMSFLNWDKHKNIFNEKKKTFFAARLKAGLKHLSCVWLHLSPDIHHPRVWRQKKEQQNKNIRHLGGEVAAELELLEGDGHGVRAEEEDEGHEGQIGDVLAGLSHQRASVLQTLLLAQLAPVQSCHIQLGWWVAVLGGETDRREEEWSVLTEDTEEKNSSARMWS